MRVRTTYAKSYFLSRRGNSSKQDLTCSMPLEAVEGLGHSALAFTDPSLQTRPFASQTCLPRLAFTEQELLSLPGVGRKTANLVLGLAFGIPAICVDIHVHRISNRLGLVQTSTPEETERALQALLPKKDWIEWNTLLVIWGQNICVPISPFCTKCAVYDECKRVGVTRSR